MTRLQSPLFSTLTALGSLVLAALLGGCGGGGSGGSPSVATLSASTVSYSRTMTVTVNGSALQSADVQMVVEGPCGPVTKVAGGTDLVQQYACTVTGLGDMFARIRTETKLELASLRLNVPVPQVSVTVRQGTRLGTFVVELDPVKAPISVDNFLAYVNGFFYTNTLFHRVIAGFVVQAGGYIAGPIRKPPNRPAIALEAGNGLSNLQYTIAMARTSAPDSATAEFYVNLVDNPSLDPGGVSPQGYAVFGKVVSGFDIVDEIGKVPTTLNVPLGLLDLPQVNVVILAATQTR